MPPLILHANGIRRFGKFLLSLPITLSGLLRRASTPLPFAPLLLPISRRILLRIRLPRRILFGLAAFPVLRPRTGRRAAAELSCWGSAAECPGHEAWVGEGNCRLRRGFWDAEDGAGHEAGVGWHSALLFEFLVGSGLFKWVLMFGLSNDRMLDLR